MANINTELNIIANSVYGSEMRSAIHDAIDKVNTDLDKTVVTLTFNEYDNLSSDKKLNGSLYFTYDTKQIFMNGVEYTQDNSVVGIKQGTCLYFKSASAPVDNLDIDLKPVQNTRGYGEAWAGGHGKNKLQLSISGTDTIDGVTYSVSEDFRVKLNGDSTDSIEIVIGTFSFSGSENKMYILNGCPSGGSPSSYRMCINGVYDYGADSDGVTVTLLPNTSYPVKIIINSGISLDNLEFKPMLREKGDANFRPYSNVCPIYKNTGVKYYSLGKNLFDANNATNVENYIINVRGERVYRSGEGYYYGIPIAPGMSYTFNGDIIPDDKVMYIYTFDEFDNVRRVYGPIAYSDLPYTFIAGPLAKSFGFSYDMNELVPESVMLEVGTIATVYEPYIDHSTDLLIGASTWGGKWHVEDGFIEEEWAEIPSYSGEILPYEWYSSENTYGVQETPNIGAQVVYKTGNITIKNVSVITISTIFGVNSVWCGGAEWIVLKYINEAWQDIVHYKELSNTEYNLLPDSDKNSGVIYFINDKGVIFLNGVMYGGNGGGSGGSRFNPYVVSDIDRSISRITVTEA